jgi:hypothetical protein
MIKYAVIIIFVISNVVALELRPCHDDEKICEVQDLIDSYHFRYAWENDTFDCADMAAANWRLLESKGYSPEIAICKYPGGGSHCYVIFPLGDGWAGVDTRKAILENRSLDSCLGKVITSLEGYEILPSDQALYAYDPRGPPTISGPVIAPNLPPLFQQ